MRYIALYGLRPDPRWIEKATAAAQAVRNARPEDRSNILKERGDLWAELKVSLSALSHGKCWYCESIDARSDNAVDHYRPKGNVKDANPSHGGYWWLAFDWRNYRFSCTYCNSIRKSAETIGGKQDYFPLWEESKRARSETDDINDELPLLLDPTKVTDVRLIAFGEDGSVGPAVTNTNVREYRCAKESATRYHLMHPIIAERRIVRLRVVRRWVEEADRQLKRFYKTEEPFALNTAENLIAEIRDAVAPQAEYSTAVKHLLAGFVNSDAAEFVLNSL